VARYKSNNYFKPGTCNTIDDVTGFKVKLSNTSRRWDGIQTTPDNWEERQPQDFPVTPRPQKTYTNSRGDQQDPVPAPLVIGNNYGL